MKYPLSQGEGLRSQLRQLQHYTGQLAKDTAGQLKQLADAQVENKSMLSLIVARIFEHSCYFDKGDG